MIRLLEVNADGSLSFREVESGSQVPLYAILSHTWAAKSEELSYSDVLLGTNRESSGYKKVLFCLQQAANDGLRYCWVDTCCIDKTNSAELSEAIISMFRWYQNSVKCYVYLSDVLEPSDLGWEAALRQSRWFTRGWTLQELLAPSIVEFYSKNGSQIGDKISLAPIVHEITKIPIEALQSRDLSVFSHKERMSWAETRTTTREEDLAYCMLGIFKVTVIPAYGEGKDEAFRRLKEAIRRLSRRQLTPGSEDDLSEYDRCNGTSTKRRKLEQIPELSAEQSQLILDSLRFDEIEARRVAIKPAHTSTCKWLLEDTQYLDWLDSKKQEEHNGFLWIKGHPGCGKSTIMKWAVENARKQLRDHIQLSFFFNARGGELEKDVAGAYRTLLVQLLDKMPNIRRVFDILGSSAAAIKPDHEWEVDSMELLLSEAVEQLGTTAVVCFIDALDESNTDDVRRMLSFLESLCQKAFTTSTRLRVCLASRHYPHVTIKKGIVLGLDDKEGHRRDIADYLATELRLGDDALSEEIRTELLDKARGSFIWAVLVVGILNKEYDQGRVHALQRRLAEIPEDVYKLFRDVLTRDSDQAEHMTEVGLCMQWILFSSKPLTARELCTAILCGVEEGTPSEIEAKVPSQKNHIRRYVLHVSKGLAEIVKSGKKHTVQFIHESVKDFFLKKDGFREIWPEMGEGFEGQSHNRLQRCSLAYLRISRSSSYAKIIRDQPFLIYAVQNVFFHADRAAKSGISPEDFLREFPLTDWVESSNLIEQHPIRKYTEQVSFEYLFAEKNLPNLIKAMRKPAYLEITNERYGPPLFAALARGSTEAARVFIENDLRKHEASSRLMQCCSQLFANADWRGKFSFSFVYPQNETVPQVLASLAHPTLVNFIIELRPDIVETGKDYSEALIAAASHGQYSLASKLVQQDMQGNTCSRLLTHNHVGMTALGVALMKGHTDIVQFLLDKGVVGTDDQLDSERDAIKVAMWLGFDEAVKALVSSNWYTKTPSRQILALGCALQNRSPNHIRLLRRAGVDIDLLDQADGQTVLSKACKEGRYLSVKLLLENGANPNVAGQYRKLPLWVTYDDLKLRYGEMHEILEYGASINVLDKNGVPMLPTTEVEAILKRVFQICPMKTAEKLLAQVTSPMSPEFWEDLLLCVSASTMKTMYILHRDVVQNTSVLERVFFEAAAKYMNGGQVVRYLLGLFTERGTINDVLKIAERRYHIRARHLILTYMSQHQIARH